MAVAPTKIQRDMWSKIADLGCIVCGNSQVEIHHCGTGGGGRKNHDFVIGLCFYHHRGEMGIDRKSGTNCLSKRKWQEVFGGERALFNKTMEMIGHG